MEHLSVNAQRHDQLSIDSQRADGTYRVSPVGSIDIASAPDLEAAIREGEDSDAKRVVIDLRGVSFIDSTGIRCLIAAHKYSRSRGRKLRIIQGSPQVRRVFEVTGLMHELPFAEDG